MSYKVVKDFTKSVTERCIGTDVLESLTPAQMIVKIVNEELTRLMGSETQHITINPKRPTVVMLVGLQGGQKPPTLCAGRSHEKAGQKSSAGGLRYLPSGRHPAAGRLRRKIGLAGVSNGPDQPGGHCQGGVQHAVRHGNDMVFLDNGRPWLHIDEALMEELKAVKAAVHPQEIMLVVDAMTGQDAVNAAQSFHERLDIDSVMLTKLDGDARGGAALSVRAVTGRPIKFVGTGEKLDQIEAFHPDRMASRILGMGDVLTLIEKAEKGLRCQEGS